MSTLIPKFGYCTTLGGTPIQNPGIAPAAGIRIGAKNGPSLGAYMVTYNGGSITGQYDYYGVFDDQILNLSPGSHTLELRENLSLPVTDSWILTVTDVNKLPAPIPREQLNDSTDDPSIIDRTKLGSNPLQVIVLTADPSFQPGDTINVIYIAKVPGKPDVVVALTGTVTTDQFGQKVPCILQVSNDQVPTGAMVTIQYDLARGVTLIGQSYIATAQVVGEATPELTIDTSDMLLTGKNYIPGPEFGWIRKAQFPGTFEQRTATNGTSPYKYESSAASASVDSTGLVQSKSNGLARITVTDSSVPPQSKTFIVYTANVYLLMKNYSTLTVEQAAEWIDSQGALRLEADDHNFLNSNYAPGLPPPDATHYHTGARNNDFPEYPNRAFVFSEHRLSNNGVFNQGVHIIPDPLYPAICRKLT
ncbi:hypothetical protein [Pseudomonas gozinkensis]|uniref:hypothetical protein n=1 Tax=Pseudomonas gozinkensis TaxID=2774461 RepID=UPI001787B040|nr:hypothetical protein [Pseudomonas gozinkensis]